MLGDYSVEKIACTECNLPEEIPLFQAHRHSIAALKELRPVKNSRGSRQSAVPAKTVVEVLRHASKSCVVKREFTKAGILVRQAVNLAAEVFGTDHPKYADALLDYGFFLLYYDSIQQCVEVYEVSNDDQVLLTSFT